MTSAVNELSQTSIYHLINKFMLPNGVRWFAASRRIITPDLGQRKPSGLIPRREGERTNTNDSEIRTSSRELRPLILFGTREPFSMEISKPSHVYNPLPGQESPIICHPTINHAFGEFAIAYRPALDLSNRFLDFVRIPFRGSLDCRELDRGDVDIGSDVCGNSPRRVINMVSFDAEFRQLLNSLREW